MKSLNANETKKEFVQSVYLALQKILKDNGNEAYLNMLRIEGSSIMFDLPPEYFNVYSIPENTRIEMKFISKR